MIILEEKNGTRQERAGVSEGRSIQVESEHAVKIYEYAKLEGQVKVFRHVSTEPKPV